jgi:hypothetical protein
VTSHRTPKSEVADLLHFSGSASEHESGVV